jgi:Fungal protein of unknown function (DUF1748)
MHRFRRRSVSYERRPETSGISDPTIRSVADRFLGVGESIFDMMQATAVNSAYFKKDTSRR